MDSIALLKQLFATSHSWYLGTVDGLTEEQTNFVPPGTTHPIGALIQHTIMSEDNLLHTRMMRRTEHLGARRLGRAHRANEPLRRRRGRLPRLPHAPERPR